MQQFTIKTHQPGRLYFAPHIFILSKGRNSGKPLHEPCPNCFVMLFPDEHERQNYYWLSYTLWQAKFWHQYQVGSVILFLRLFEFRKVFAQKCESMQASQEAHHKNLRALHLLQLKEIQFQKDLALVAEMRKAILFRYIKN